MVGVVGQGVAYALFLLVLLLLLHGGYRVGVAIVVVVLEVASVHHRLIATLPVVLVLTLSPPALELLFSGRHRLWVVEVPGSSVLRQGCGPCVRSTRSIVLCLLSALGTIRGGGGAVGCSLFLRLLFLLFQGLYNSVDGSQTVGLRHSGQFLKTVLQFHRTQWWRSLVQGLRAHLCLFILLMFLVQDGYTCRIGALGIDVLLRIPVQL